jgi:hypothetical protein
MNNSHANQTKNWWKMNNHIGDIMGQTESTTTVAAPAQAIGTYYFKNTIFEEETDSKCWLHKQYEETIDHLTSG